MQPRPTILSLALILATIGAGLAIRRVPLHLPLFFVKYAGSMLWALMIYWIVSSLLPRRPVPTAAIVSAGIATAVELLKLYHSLALDTFRLTLAGTLLLGRVFSIYDIATYCVAIAIGAIIDSRLRPSHLPPRSS